MQLTEQQQKQVLLQVAAHKHNKYYTDIYLTDTVVLKHFAVFPKVLRPEIMCAIHLARWLYFNNGLYLGKKVIDIGCGSGIQGITVGLHGAAQVVCSDISPHAVANTSENVLGFNLRSKILVRSGDLFENIHDKAHLLTFNHPFFSDGTMEEQISIPPSMLIRGTLLQRFLEEAKQYLLPGGKIIMPYFHLAGAVNDPGVQASRHGYEVKVCFRNTINSGLQKGLHSIYELIQPV